MYFFMCAIAVDYPILVYQVSDIVVIMNHRFFLYYVSGIPYVYRIRARSGDKAFAVSGTVVHSLFHSSVDTRPRCEFESAGTGGLEIFL